MRTIAEIATYIITEPSKRSTACNINEMYSAHHYSNTHAPFIEGKQKQATSVDAYDSHTAHKHMRNKIPVKHHSIGNFQYNVK